MVFVGDRVGVCTSGEVWREGFGTRAKDREGGDSAKRFVQGRWWEAGRGLRFQLQSRKSILNFSGVVSAVAELVQGDWGWEAGSEGAERTAEEG